MYELPTRSDRVYRGKYPHRVASTGYSRSLEQMFISQYLGIRAAYHLELNDGRRFIACITELRNGDSFVSRDIQEVLKKHPTPIERLSQERYDEMLEGIRQIRGYKKP